MAAIVVATLAGCLDDDSTPQQADTTDATAPTPPAAEPFNATFEWEMGAAASAVVVTVNLGNLLYDSRGTVDVPDGMARIDATADGTCQPAPACSFALVAYRGGEMHSYAEGTLPLTLTIDEPGRGNWDLILYPDANGSAIVDASGNVTVAGTPA